MAKKSYPSDAQDQYMVRFPNGMRDKIKEAAEANGRSMNAEIITRLQKTLDWDGHFEARDAGGSLPAEIATLSKELKKLRNDLLQITDVRVLPDGSREFTVATQPTKPTQSD